MINAIFAVDEAGALGYKNGLPWPHNAEDLHHFRFLTLDKTIVMGSSTWDSLPTKPLKHRHNIIVTREPWRYADVPNKNVETIHPDVLEERLRNTIGKVFIIGGAQTIMSTLHLVDKLYVTTIEGKYEADIFIDMEKVLSKFELAALVKRDNCTFREYNRCDSI